MLNHGGNIEAMSRQFPQFKGEWLDLSTAIAPWSWPVVSDLPETVWQRLPYERAPLCASAATYYGVEANQLIPVPGSQLAIELLPSIMMQSSIALPRWAYGQHAASWARHRHRVLFYNDMDQLQELIQSRKVNNVLVVNPNNPTGETLASDTLLGLQQALFTIGGYLIVDEAFADMDDSCSVLQFTELSNVIVFRSVGKFFGMGGLRLGFVIAPVPMLRLIDDQLPMWVVSGPALWLGKKMLEDADWQLLQRQRAIYYRENLMKLLQQALPEFQWHPGPLFISTRGDQEPLQQLHQFLGEQGILVRLFKPIDNSTYMRIGLADETGLLRLTTALNKWGSTRDF